MGKSTRAPASKSSKASEGYDKQGRGWVHLVRENENQRPKDLPLDWIKKLTSHKKNEIINDSVDILDAGEYDNLKDPQVREKMKKYGLDFGQLLEPSPYVKIKMTSKDETISLTFKAPVEDLNNGIQNTWTVKKE